MKKLTVGIIGYGIWWKHKKSSVKWAYKVLRTPKFYF
jgi:hypothetical protein